MKHLAEKETVLLFETNIPSQLKLCQNYWWWFCFFLFFSKILPRPSQSPPPPGIATSTLLVNMQNLVYRTIIVKLWHGLMTNKVWNRAKETEVYRD